ncbi:MAG: hypothetical protein Q7S51_02845 [Gallionellaceae bacterium]|nr:hypothetical protein [Gallionellaceae bacterium]
MKSQTLLFLGANYLHAYLWQDGLLSLAQEFSDSTEGRGQFSAFLKTHRQPTRLLVDLSEEDFRYDTIPHLRGSDRSALLQRKFEQYYRNTPFRKALLQQRQPDGRRDDEILFSALTNPTLILPWLEIMAQHSTPLAGIYSVPDLSTPLVKDILSDHVLLLSWEKHAGLRQTYFKAKRLHFSRLTPMGSNNSFSELVASEALRTHQYLKSLSLLPDGSALDVHIVCHATDQRQLAAQLQSNAEMRYAYLDIQQLGLHLKSKTPYQESDATLLLLHLLATQPPHSHYAAAKHTHFFQLWQLRKSLRLASTVLAVASLLWSMANLWEGRGLTATSESLQQQAGQLAQQAQKITQDFPNNLAAATDMKTAVLLLRKLDDHSPPPQKILAGLSTTLDAFPRIHVDKLSWQVSAAADVMNTAGTPATAPAQIILLSGELEEWAGDYRAALNYVERFQQALIQRGHTVTALILPLDISPKGNITADVGKSNAKPAQFSLKIIWRPTP